MRPTAHWAALLAPLLAPAGGLLVMLAERMWPGMEATPYLAGLGAAAVLSALALSLPLFAGPGGLRAGGWLIAPYALFVLALALYYSQGWLPVEPLLGVHWRTLAFGGWVLALVAGAVLFGFITLAMIAQRRVPAQDDQRLRTAGAAGLSLALLSLLVALLYGTFAQLPWQWNLAYLKTAHPSEATLELVQGLAEPVEVAAFFETDNEVTPFVRDYFQALGVTLDAADGAEGAGGADAGKLHVRFVDADLDPDSAERFKARGNGWVVLRKGELLRPIRVGDAIERARSPLRTLDRSFFAKLLELSVARSVVYLTVGHGERSERDTQQGRGLDRLRTLLRDLNYTVKELGIGEGLGERVPEDAALVIVVGPTRPLLQAEADSLRRYLDEGGGLLAFVEPRRRSAPARRDPPGTSLDELLRGYGVIVEPVPLANDRIHARRTQTKADRSLLVTVGYQDHPAVQSLRRGAKQFPLVLLDAGSLKATNAPKGLTVRETLRGMPGTWADSNGDFEFNAKTERRTEPVLGLAVSRPDRDRPRRGSKVKAAQKVPGATLLIYADADLAADLLLRNRANEQLIDDALGWLVSRDAPAGLPESEEDVRIQHAKNDDWLWFYLPVLGVPLAVLGLGIFRISRQRRGRGGAHE